MHAEAERDLEQGQKELFFSFKIRNGIALISEFFFTHISFQTSSFHIHVKLESGIFIHWIIIKKISHSLGNIQYYTLSPPTKDIISFIISNHLVILYCIL